MQTGTCALCGTIGKLHDSHFLPKSVYRLLRRSNDGNLSPVHEMRECEIISIEVRWSCVGERMEFQACR